MSLGVVEEGAQGVGGAAGVKKVGRAIMEDLGGLLVLVFGGGEGRGMGKRGRGKRGGALQ